jgi:hypothetical protein
MAQMYPDPIDPDTTSRAERELYQHFQRQLGPAYHVFHSVRWQDIDPATDRAKDGEIDFVIAHAELGILVIEAKGGTVQHRPSQGEWVSIDHKGDHHILNVSPVTQASKNRFALRAFLARKEGIAANHFAGTLGHAVAFPDVIVPASWIRPDLPRPIILDQAALLDVSGWIQTAFKHYAGSSSPLAAAATARAVHNLIELLGRTWTLKPRLSGQVAHIEQKLIQLTHEQFKVLTALRRWRRVKVAGCAGSGKTMLALEKALELARNGHRVLLTCFNRPLAARLRGLVGVEPRLTIATFHEVCYTHAERAGLRVPPAPEPTARGAIDFYDVELPSLLTDAAGRLGPEYDAVIVDEGQDFRDLWWLALEGLVTNGSEGILFVFYDDNQRIYNKKLSIPIANDPIVLTVNCRNTDQVHAIVRHFYLGDESPTPSGVQGAEPQIEVLPDVPTRTRRLREILEAFRKDQGLKPSQVTVLAPRQKTLADLRADPGLRKLLRGSQDEDDGRTSLACTIHHFKGLESDVVILIGIDDPDWHLRAEDKQLLMYVGTSRPRGLLVVLLRRDGDMELHTLLSERGGTGLQV